MKKVAITFTLAATAALLLIGAFAFSATLRDLHINAQTFSGTAAPIRWDTGLSSDDEAQMTSSATSSETVRFDDATARDQSQDQVCPLKSLSNQEERGF